MMTRSARRDPLLEESGSRLGTDNDPSWHFIGLGSLMAHSIHYNCLERFAVEISA